MSINNDAAFDMAQVYAQELNEFNELLSTLPQEVYNLSKKKQQPATTVALLQKARLLTSVKNLAGQSLM